MTASGGRAAATDDRRAADAAVVASVFVGAAGGAPVPDRGDFVIEPADDPAGCGRWVLVASRVRVATAFEEGKP
jgi:hypothetical protein